MPIKITQKTKLPQQVDVPASIPVEVTSEVPPVEVPPSPPAVEATPEKTARRKLVVEINAETHRKLRVRAANQDKTLTELVDGVLTAEVSDD